MKNYRLIASLVLLLWCTCGMAQQLRFHKDGTFKIVQFTDVHWVPGDEKSEIAAERMNQVLDEEKPDLVVYTGDLCFGKPGTAALDKALEPVVNHGIPFAVVWGNHDDEQGFTRQELFDHMKNKPGNLTGTTPGLFGVTNYILPIQNSKGTGSAFTLYMLDSGSYSLIPSIKGYDWIKDNQVQWYRRESARILEENHGDTIPAMAFFHIPLPEYAEANTTVGNPMIGTRKEMVCSPELNSGMFNAIIERGDVMATMAGHDHINDYATLWKGVLLCYGRYSGGNTVYNNIAGGNGARVILLQEGQRSFRSWIRLKDAKVINDFTYPDDFK